MIQRIVKDVTNQIFEPIDHIKEKLDHFRNLSATGIHNLGEDQIESLRHEIRMFFNVKLGFAAPTRPGQLFRVTVNSNIIGRRGELTRIDQLMGPPPGRSWYGRCNLPAESVFYCALNFETAIIEVQPQIGDYITVSEWKIKEGENLFTHSIFHPNQTILNRESQIAYDQYIEGKNRLDQRWGEVYDELLAFYTEEFMKPVNREQSENYLFSAINASEFLNQLPDENDIKIHAVSYPSVRREYGLTNIAICNAEVLNKLDLVKISYMDVIETNYGDPEADHTNIIQIRPPQFDITNFDFDNGEIINLTPEEKMNIVLDLENRLRNE